MSHQTISIRSANIFVINMILSLVLLSTLSTLGQVKKVREVPVLPLDGTLKRTIKGGEIHSYKVMLKTGEYFHVEVDQLGVDVLLSMVNPRGRVVVERDRPNDTVGQESLSFSVTLSGEYRLDVKARDKKAGAGRYEIKGETPRTPTEKDKKRIAAEILYHQGLQLSHVGTLKSVTQARGKYEAAAAAWREIGDKYSEALAQTSLGDANNSVEKNEEAVVAHQRASLLYRELKDRPLEALSLSRLCLLYAFLQKPDLALDYYRKAQAIYRELQDAVGERRLSAQLSKAVEEYLLDGLELSGKGTAEASRTALTLLTVAREMYRGLEDERGEADSLTGLGDVNTALGEHQTALDFYKQALPLYIKVGDGVGVARTLNNIGGEHLALGDRPQALEHYNKALLRYKDIGEKDGIVTVLGNIGSLYAYSGDSREALNYYNEALPFYKAGRDKDSLATLLNNIGSAYEDLGEHQKALDHFEKQALPLFRAARNRAGIATTLLNIGRVHESLGEKRRALYFYEKRALPLCIAIGDKSREAKTLNNIGSVYYSLGEKRRALYFYEKRALPLSKQIGDKHLIATTLNNIGSVLDDLGEKRQAIDIFEKEVLPLRREVGDKTGEATTLNNIGVVYASLGEHRKALDYYEKRALPLRREIGDRLGEAVILANMMAAWDDLKNPRLAIFYGKRAVNALQHLRVKNQGLDKEFQKTFLNSVEDFYRFLADLLIDQGRLAEALQVLNAFKDQQYFDFNRERTMKPSPLAPTPREADFGSRYMAAVDRVGNARRHIEKLEHEAINRVPHAEELTKRQRLEADLKTAMDDFFALMKQGEEEFGGTPDAAKDKEPDVEDAGKIRAALRAPGKKAVTVYTVVGEKHFHALAVTHDDIVAVTSHVRGDELNYKAKQLWALLQSDEYDPTTLSKEIYDVVFKPVKDRLLEEKKLEEVLPEGATIMWSLDGNLRYLPMNALYDGQKYLVERYNNVVFTRAESERWTRAVSSTWTGVGFGSSRGGLVNYVGIIYPFDRLPHVSAELNSVFKTSDADTGIFEGRIFPDSKFNRQAMLAALEQHRPLVHIASHFEFSPGDASRSFLLLGDGTVFPLNEMRRHTDLFRGVELLTLSACETGAQWSDSDGREVDGFAELAQRQGAAAVLATLWKVRDDSSYRLLRDFYERKRRAPEQRKSECLRQAQIALLDGTAEVTPLTRAGIPRARKRGGNSTVVKILPERTAPPVSKEDGVVYVEARYARPYNGNGARRYAHPYFWSPFVLFGNWL